MQLKERKEKNYPCDENSGFTLLIICLYIILQCELESSCCMLHP